MKNEGLKAAAFSCSEQTMGPNTSLFCRESWRGAFFRAPDNKTGRRANLGEDGGAVHVGGGNEHDKAQHDLRQGGAAD